MTAGFEPRRLRVPDVNGATMVEPPWDEVGAVATDNLHQRQSFCYDLQGRSFDQVSRMARRELLAEAIRWTSAYRDVGSTPAQAGGGPIFLAGHQPQLFHPGVWFKNFVLGTLAERHGATAVNLLIDTDTFKQNTVSVPGGSLARPRRESLAMDRPERPIPLESRRILDAERFGMFGDRVAEHIEPLVPDPLIRDYWPMVQARMRHTDNLGTCLAQSRHLLEGQWGLRTLEVPESVLCECESFGWFASHLLARLPRFHAVYNEALRAYRRRNKIRGTAHPAPDLAADGPWLEAPFWIWTAEDPVRRRLFARPASGRIELSDRRSFEFDLALSADSSADRAVEQLAELARAGVKIRARALVTTLWARLALGDLFVHGIGGAKYDQVTDMLIAKFFDRKPPGFLVVSGTLHLPASPPEATDQEARRLDHRLRELQFHPERYIHSDTATSNTTAGVLELAALLAAKRLWVSTMNGRQRFLEIRRLNEALQPWVAGERRRVLAEQARVAEALRVRSVLCHREYAFCLYPEKTLRDFLRQSEISGQ